jgi:predicted phosphodiesterase
VRLLNRDFKCKGRGDTFYLYVIGDCHIGARNCAESYLRRLIQKIRDTPNAYWLGGGDVINAVKPQDSKRFDMDALPDWILEGEADTIRAKLKDIVRQEKERFVLMVEPIKDRCIGMVEGNHESAISHWYNVDVHQEICDALETENLTDCAFVRLRFGRQDKSETVVVFICHGHGGGRTSGAEPNHLFRMAADKDADILLRGHSHSYCIHPPIATLYVPTHGDMPKECRAKYKRAANWGTWLRSYAAGAPTYDSRACYPARSLSTLEICIEPHRCVTHDGSDAGRISMSELVL